MARLKAAFSTAVIDVPDASAGQYEAAGWVKVEKPKPEWKPKTDKG